MAFRDPIPLLAVVVCLALAPLRAWPGGPAAATARIFTFEDGKSGAAPAGFADRTFSRPGRIGLWTKADSITYFDDLTVQPL